jgi:hypothetical protein
VLVEKRYALIIECRRLALKKLFTARTGCRPFKTGSLEVRNAAFNQLAN